MPRWRFTNSRPAPPRRKGRVRFKWMCCSIAEYHVAQAAFPRNITRGQPRQVAEDRWPHSIAE